MAENPTQKALKGLRSVVQAGGPSVPVKSHATPTSTIGPVSPWQKLQEKILPVSDTEPLAQHGVLNALIGQGQPKGNPLGSMEDVGGMSPIMGSVVSKLPKFWHDIPDLEAIVGGGPVRLYHGTTLDNAAKISQEGLKLHQSGDSAARAMAERYGIPWKTWKRNEPYTPYQDETRNLSTSTYPIAERWAKNFPQGEIDSDLNAKARIMVEAQRRGQSYNRTYNDIYKEAEKLGVRNSFEVPDALQLPDLMKPQNPGGAIFGVDTEASHLRSNMRRAAEHYLDDIKKGEYSPLDGLKSWNNTYMDFKVNPEHIKNLEIVSKFPKLEKK